MQPYIQALWIVISIREDKKMASFVKYSFLAGKNTKYVIFIV